MMKTTTIFKTLGVIAITAVLSNRAEAQRTVSTAAAGDFTRQAAAALGGSNGSVRVVDNKGTIKYLQANNGITTLTDFTPNGGIVTTWQLGGTLTDNTYINATGKVFGLDGISLLTGAASAAASTNAVTNAVHGTPANTGTGWTFLVRDEATGAIQKLQASDLDVTAINTVYTQVLNATANVPITVTGLPAIATGSPNAGKLSVYRNGVKLRLATAAIPGDFTVTANTVTINFNAADIPMFAGDIVEVSYIN